MGFNVGPAPRGIPGGMPRRCLIEMDDGRWIEGYVQRMDWMQRPRIYDYVLDDREGARFAVPGRTPPIEIELRLFVANMDGPEPTDLSAALEAVKTDYRIPVPVPPPGMSPEPVPEPEPEPEPEPALRRFSELEIDEEPKK
jgi:hypothetical protein